MSEEQNEIDIYETLRFKKALNKLSKKQLKIVEDEIDKILTNPEIGNIKKGDLSYLRVHKFKMNRQEVLLGYSWLKDKIEIYLLHISSHENFYQNMKNKRKIDLNLITP